MWTYAAAFTSNLTNQLKPENFLSFRLLFSPCHRRQPLHVTGFPPLSLRTHSKTLSKSGTCQQRISCIIAPLIQAKKDLSKRMTKSLFLLITWIGASHRPVRNFSETFSLLSTPSSRHRTQFRVKHLQLSSLLRSIPSRGAQCRTL